MRIKRENILRISLVLVLFIFIFTLLYFGSFSVLKSLYPCKYGNFVETYSKENNLSTDFVYAVIKCESNFDKDAVSSVGAEGLMQLMPDTFNWIKSRLKEDSSDSSAFDPETNIKYGCHYYAYLIKRFGSEELAVTAYHAGPGNLQKWLKDKKYSPDGKTLVDIPFPTTKKYVKKVIETKKIYSNLYG